jgi:hypothetical protein
MVIAKLDERISGDLRLVRRRVEAERSEFILSLDGRRSHPNQVIRGKEKHTYVPLADCVHHSLEPG